MFKKSVPTMVEVFGLNEANVTTLAQMNKIPLSTAQKINDFDRKNSPALAQVIAFRGKNLSKNIAPEKLSEWWDNYAEMMLGSYGQKIAYAAQKGKLTSAFLSSMKDDFQSFIDQLNSFWNEKNLKDISSRAILTFPDGSYWVKLEGDECAAEGDAMQHCGRGHEDGDMYSYRTKEGKPHVTVDVVEDMRGLTFEQISGKQNDVPNRKYWPQVKALAQKLGVVRFRHTNIEKELNDFLFPGG